MQTSDRIYLIGPCGIDCGACECYRAKDELKLMEYLISKGFPPEKLPCPGCRPNQGKCAAIGGTCATYSCVTDHKVDYCYDCPEFPCSKLNPAADRANVLPHNLKVFNLCLIERQGAEEFLEKYAEIKRKYYQGKMAIGQGPRVD